MAAAVSIESRHATTFFIFRMGDTLCQADRPAGAGVRDAGTETVTNGRNALGGGLPQRRSM